MDINKFMQDLAIMAPPILFALSFHEAAHGYVALKLGDPTAKEQGRLTLNPVKHLDPWGVLAFFIIKIGWAKPVPVNPRYFKNPQQDMLKVALAGPVSNILLAIISVIILKIVLAASVLPMVILEPLADMLVYSIWINIALAVFNFIPIPPLDGSRILMGLLPPDLAYKYTKVEPYGFIVILFLFWAGLLSKVIMPIINYFYNILLRLIG